MYEHYEACKTLLVAQIYGEPAPAWHLIEFDVEDRVKARMRQKMALSRYGRVDFFGWNHRPVAELDAATAVLTEMLENEDAVPGWNERNG